MWTRLTFLFARRAEHRVSGIECLDLWWQLAVPVVIIAPGLC